MSSEGGAATEIHEDLVRALLAAQMPQFAGLPVRAVPAQAWDNRSFRVGNEFVARLPSHEAYAAQIQIEQMWLPRLAAGLPLEIPEPVALGKPGCGYPWAWSLRRWIAGESAASNPPTDIERFAMDLAGFLKALRGLPIEGAPRAGPQSFHRGGDLAVYDAQFREAISLLAERIDAKAALILWEAALPTSWDRAPVWLHGDIALGNLIVRGGKLAAVIDFGQACVGDPACDCAIAWTFFSGRSRQVFRQALGLDDATWLRGQAWALWKAAILAADLTNTNAVEASRAWETLSQVLAAGASHPIPSR